MDFSVIRLKLLEPIMLRGPGEFDPGSRGTYSYASSMILPRPSTMLGMLISIVLTSGKYTSECMDIYSWADLFNKCYIKVFNELGIEALRGPYIVKNNSLFVPIMFWKKLFLLDYYRARYLLLNAYDNIFKKLLGKDNERSEKALATLRLLERDINNNFEQYVIEPYHVQFTGIHLKTREAGKVAKEGYIYTATYVTYLIDAEIVFLLALKDKSKALDYLPSRGVTKFGGEGRIVEMSVERGNSIMRKILSTLSEIEKAEYAILVSPTPLLRNNSFDQLIITGQRTTIGLGFSLARKRRKPIYTGISEGSIIKIDTRKEKPKREEVISYGLYGLLDLKNNKHYRYMGRLGYASFVPLVP